MPGFLAGLFVDRARRISAVTMANATTGRCPSVALDLLRTVAKYEPPLAAEWVPEPELSQGEELLGSWYWGNTPFMMSVADATLLLSGGMRSRFIPESPDVYRGLAGSTSGR